MPPVKAYQIPDWANPQNASVLDNWWTRTARTIGQFMGVDNPESQVMGLATAPVDVPAADAAQGLKQTLRAYHGSPHDFDAFDSSKIGTGEGAQAYGHGLYFAENPATAESYKDLMVKTDAARWNAIDYAGKLLQETGGDFDRALARVPERSGAASILREAKASGKLPSQGAMYEVNIHASPDELLDWDKPLSQQPPKVQEAFQKATQKNAHLPFFEGVTDADLTHRYYGKENVQDMSGAGVMQILEQAAGKSGAPQLLKDAGIKGIQYLDQGSRAAGQGTRNFVIFDDKIIDIARKYGLSLPAAYQVYQAQQRLKPQQKGVE